MEKYQQIAQSIAKLLQCSICLETFTDPVSVGCGHFFCRNCIGVLLRSKSEAPCPMCKWLFTRRHIQEASQRQKIVVATTELVNSIENMMHKADSGEKQAKSPSGSTPAILLSSDLKNHSSARNVKKAKPITIRNPESVEISNEQNQGMISYFVRKDKTNSDEAGSLVRKGETKFYHRLQPDDSEDFVYPLNREEPSKLGKNERKSLQTNDIMQTENCKVQNEKHVLEDGKKDSFQKEKEIESGTKRPHDFIHNLEDEKTPGDVGKKSKTSHKKQAKGSSQKALTGKQNLKRDISSPILSRKKRRIIRIKLETSANKTMAVAKKQTGDNLSLNGKKGSLKCLPNEEDSSICSLKDVITGDILSLDGKKVSSKRLSNEKDNPACLPTDAITSDNLPLDGKKSSSECLSNEKDNPACLLNEKNSSNYSSNVKSCPQVVDTSEIPTECVEPNETSVGVNALLNNNCENGGSDGKNEQCNQAVGEGMDSGAPAESESAANNVTDGTKNISLNLETDSSSNTKNKKNIGSLLSRTASLKSCQKLISNKKSLLKRARHIKDDKNVDRIKDSKNTLVDELGKDDPISLESVCVLSVTSPEPHVEDRDYMSRSPGWSRIKQLNKDFHLRKFSLLQVQKNKNLQSPNVSVCEGFETRSVKERHGSEGSNASEGLQNVEKEDSVSPNKDKSATSETENMDHDVQPAEPLSDTTNLPGNASKKLNFDQQKVANDNEQYLNMGNTAPFYLNEDMDVDAVFVNNAYINPNETIMEAENDPQLLQSANGSSLSLPEEPGFQFTCVKEFSNSCEPGNNSNLKRSEPANKQIYEVVHESLEKALPVSDRSLKFKNLINQNAEVMHSYEENNSLLKDLLSKNDSSGSETTSTPVHNHINEKQQQPVSFSINGGRKRSSSIHSIGAEHKFNNFLTEKSFESSKSEKVVKRICLTLDEICAYFNDSNTSGATENICTVSLPFSNYKLQLTVADETLNISILKVLRSSLCENFNVSNNTSFHDSKSEPLNVTSKETKDAQTQCETYNVDAQTQSETRNTDAEIQCSISVVRNDIKAKRNSQINSSMESLPETQPWIEPKKNDDDDCNDWLSESIITETNLEALDNFEQALEKSPVCQFKNDQQKSDVEENKNGDEIENDVEKMPNETLYISSSSIPSFHSLNNKSPEFKYLLETGSHAKNENLSAHKKEDIHSAFVNDEDCYLDEDDNDIRAAHRCSTPISEIDKTTEKAKTNSDKSGHSILESSGKNKNGKSGTNRTSSEILFAPTKFSNSKNTYSKASILQKLEIEALKKEKIGKKKLDENNSPMGKSSPIELYLSESFDPFSDPKGFGKNSPVLDRVEAEFAEILKETENNSSDPDMIFATNLVAPLKDIARKEKEFPLIAKAQKLSPKDRVTESKEGTNSSPNVVKPSQNSKQFKRISTFGSDSSGSDELPDLRNRLKRKKRVNKHSFLTDVIKALEDDDVECDTSGNLNNPQALSRVFANIDADLNISNGSPKPLNKAPVKDAHDTKCIFEVPMLCGDEDPSESASKLELELDEMKQEVEKLRKEIFQEESIGVNNSSDQENGIDDEERNALSVSKENSNDFFSEQIPPTPPNPETVEKHTKYTSKIYNRN